VIGAGSDDAVPAADRASALGDATAIAAAEAGRWLRPALSAVLDDEHDLTRISRLRRSLADAVARLP
jgi:hypothetical protein